MKNFYVLLAPGQAQLYNPYRQAWCRLFLPSNEQEALEEAKFHIEELAKEDVVAQSFKSLIDGFAEKGFTLREALNGLAELAHRESYPDEVGRLLERASEAAAEEPVCKNLNFDLIREKLGDDLATAQQFLQAAYDAAVKVDLESTHYELNRAIADALNGCSEAVQYLDDAPDV
jgi:hypothetical protein